VPEADATSLPRPHADSLWGSALTRDTVSGRSEDGFADDYQAGVKQRGQIRDQLVRANELVIRIG
jgi:hypothetical protein